MLGGDRRPRLARRPGRAFQARDAGSIPVTRSTETAGRRRAGIGPTPLALTTPTIVSGARSGARLTVGNAGCPAYG